MKIFPKLARRSLRSLAEAELEETRRGLFKALLDREQLDCYIDSCEKRQTRLITYLAQQPPTLTEGVES